jgi:hypothetical protein
MAIGDKALAKGMRLTPGTVLANTIDDEINRALDYVAEFTSDVTPVSKGGTGATNAATARTNLGFPAIGAPDQAAPGQLPVYNGVGQLTTNDPTASGHAASKAYVDPISARADDAFNRANNAQGRADEGNANGIAARQGNLYADSYGRALSGTRRAAWLQDNGQLGYAASSQRYKKFIRPEDVTDEQILQLVFVSYQWKAAIATDDRREMGLIAERLVEAGLGWACFFGEDGVEGINYEMIGVALLPAVQRLITRVSRLEDNA